MQSAARKRGGLERGEISNAEMFGNLWNLFRMRSFRKVMKLGADKCKRGQFVQEPGGGCTMKLGLPSVMSPAVGNNFVCYLTCVLYLYLIKMKRDSCTLSTLSLAMKSIDYGVQ